MRIPPRREVILKSQPQKFRGELFTLIQKTNVWNHVSVMYPHQTPTKNPKPTSKVATAIRVSTIGNADRFPRNSAFPGPTQTRPPAQTFPREQTAQYKSCPDSRAPMDRTSTPLPDRSPRNTHRGQDAS